MQGGYKTNVSHVQKAKQGHGILLNRPELQEMEITPDGVNS